MVDGKQLAICFHVDDIMSSHVDKKVNDKFLVWLNQQHGEHGEVKATRGNAHDHSGMIFRFKDGKVEIDMVECVKSMLKEFLVKFTEMVENATPAGVEAKQRNENDIPLDSGMGTVCL